MYFRCKICQTPLSKTVFEIEDESRLCPEDGRDFIPQGFYTVGTGEEFTATFGKYLLNLKDVVNIDPHPDESRRHGCCGLDGTSEINTVCRNGHEIGSENSDCWLPHYFQFEPERVDIINND